MVKQLDLFSVLRDHPPPPDNLDLWTPDDIFASPSQEIKSAFREDYRLDRKSARKEPKALADDICAFANTSPHGGVIIVSVEDDGKITGFSKHGPPRFNKFEQVGDFCPNARLEFCRLEVTNKDGQQDVVLAIRVYYNSNRFVEITSGDVFVRQGDYKRRLTEPEKREVRIARGEIDYEKETVSLRYPQDCDISPLDLFVNSYVQARKLAGGRSRDDVLALNHLGKVSGGAFQPNLACTLLFARDPRAACPGAGIRLQRFEGTTEWSGAKYNLRMTCLSMVLYRIFLEKPKRQFRARCATLLGFAKMAASTPSLNI